MVDGGWTRLKDQETGVSANRMDLLYGLVHQPSTINHQRNRVTNNRRVPDCCLLLNRKAINLAGGRWSNAVGFEKELELLTGFSYGCRILIILFSTGSIFVSGSARENARHDA